MTNTNRVALRTYTVFGLANRPDAVAVVVLHSEAGRREFAELARQLHYQQVEDIRALSGSAARREWRKRRREEVSAVGE